MDHIRNARNYAALPDATCEAVGINPLCGDELTVYLRVDESRLRAVSFLCTCCGISMASASVMVEMLEHKTVHEAREHARVFLARLDGTLQSPSEQEAEAAILGAVRKTPSRAKCAALVWRTLQAALDGRETATSES